MTYNRWVSNKYELYHHGIKGMKWGVRRDRPSGGGRYIRGMKRDLTLLNEREYNTTRKNLARDVDYGKISYSKYEMGLAAAKSKYKSKKVDIKRLKQTKSKEETRKDFEKLRTKAMSEIPHYKLKSGVKTANKILTGIAVGSLAISAGAYAYGATLVAASYGTAIAGMYAKAGAANVATSGAYAGASHYIRTRVSSRLT